MHIWSHACVHIWPHTRVPSLTTSRLGSIFLAHTHSLRDGAALPAAPALEGGSLPKLRWGPTGSCWARGAAAAGFPAMQQRYGRL